MNLAITLGDILSGTIGHFSQEYHPLRGWPSVCATQAPLKKLDLIASQTFILPLVYSLAIYLKWM